MLPDYQLPKKLILAFGSKKSRKKVVKTNLQLDLYGLKLQLFSYKNVSQIAGKSFAMQYSFTDHLKQKIVNKTN